jgi:hypothetical protein
MNKTFYEIKEAIYDKLVDTEYGGISHTENLLAEIIGKSVEVYDSKIDDGADGDDEYVMLDAFTTSDRSIDILIYYGNCTLNIGCVEVRDNFDMYS